MCRRNTRMRWCSWGAVIGFLCWVGFALTVHATPSLPVVATFSILGEVVHIVGGTTVSLTTLVGPDGDTHNFEPSPRDGIALTEAKLIFEIGLEFETWLDDLYDASTSQARRIVVSDGLELLKAEASADHVEKPSDPASASRAADDHHGHHDHGEYDPHVWHDVQNLMQITQRVRDALIQAAPAHAETYRHNAKRHIQALRDLDQWMVARIDSLPPARRKLVTSHDTFGYFAKRYGFTIVGAALSSFSTEHAEPSAGELAALVNQIKAENVPAIFAETMHSSRIIQQLARETQVMLPPPLYTDALGLMGSAGETYIQMMRHNVDIIVNALQPRS